MKNLYEVRNDAGEVVSSLNGQYQSYNNSYYAIAVVTNIAYKGKGYGKKVYEMMLSDADKEGVTVEIGDTTSVEKWKQDWFKRLGFVFRAGRMIRKPRSQS